MIQRAVCILVLALTAAAASAQEAGFKLVVNAANEVGSLSKEQVARYFLKKTTKWPSGQAAAPVDQVEGAPARQSLSRAILNRDVRAVKSFWEMQIFSGRGVPPPEVASDGEVLAFVRTEAGAIGYVSAETPVVGVKVLRVTE